MSASIRPIDGPSTRIRSRWTQLILKQLGQAFDAELAKKGLQRVSGETSDLVIVFQLATGQEKLLTTFTNEYSYGPDWRPVWYTYSGGFLRHDAGRIENQ